MNGIIDISQLTIPPEKHELATARFFAKLGKEVVFLPPRHIPEAHTPDILMDGIEWEIKSPTGQAKRTIEKNFRVAIKQSSNIIFDLRRINVPEEQCMSQLRLQFEKRHARRLLIITKSGMLIEWP